MFQNLARCLRTRRTTVGPAVGPSLASRRFYATGQNKDIIKMLNECADEELSSSTKSYYKVRSFNKAAAAIEELDFKVHHGDELMKVKGVGPGTRKRINAFLGHKMPPTRTRISKSHEKSLKENALKELRTVPGVGRLLAAALYDAGCDTVAKLRLEEYSEMLKPRVRRALKYFEYLGAPVPRENAETILEFCRRFLPLGGYEIILAGDYRRGASTISKPIELLIIDKSTDVPVPTLPHPFTLKPTDLLEPLRGVRPNKEDYEKAPLLRDIVRPLENLGVVADAITPGVHGWQGWVRVPKKGESWESRKERLDGIRTLNGDFCLLNITYAPKQSRGSAIFALTGDNEYVLDCARKALHAGLYLNEWGLWEWEPDSQSLSRFQTSDAPYERTTLGAMWGSETKADKGRWVQLETIEEEQVLAAIGLEYVQPEKRNFRFLTKERKKAEKKGLIAAARV